MQPEIIPFDLNINNIENFSPIQNQRAVRKQQIKHLRREFKNGNYIEASPIFVSKRGRKFIVIDGNHRILAIRELLQQNVKSSFKVTLGIFYDLPESLQRDVYDRIAKQVPQTVNDLINLHKDEFMLWELLNEKPFPIKTTIYPSKVALSLKVLLNMLNSANVKDKKAAMCGLSRDEILIVGRKTTEKDFETLTEFFKVFVAIFGLVNKNNRYCNTNFLFPIYYVWKRNLGYKELGSEKTKNLGRKQYWVRRIEKLIGDTRIIELCSSQNSRENRERGVDLILSILNDSPLSKAKKKGKYQQMVYEDFK